VKTDTHPKSHPVCFIDVSSGTKFLTQSTVTSKKTETIDGIEYQVIVQDVTSDSHPAYTGEKRLLIALVGLRNSTTSFVVFAAANCY